jgi:hypothetical protein
MEAIVWQMSLIYIQNSAIKLYILAIQLQALHLYSTMQYDTCV